MIIKTEVLTHTETNDDLLSEAYIPVKNDRVYANQRKYIIICTLDSLVPKGIDMLDPDYLAGGISEFTFNNVKEYFTFLPLSRKNQVPFHYYTEIFQNNYITMVGTAKTSASWYLEYLVKARILEPKYMDSILICLQENYANEPLERNLMEVLANDLVTPLMKEYTFGYNNVVFLENIVDRDMLETSKYFKHIKKPTYLHEVLFSGYLKKYSKR